MTARALFVAIMRGALFVAGATLIMSSVGCKSIQRLPGMEGTHDTPNPDYHPINPDDFTVTGRTVVDNDVVYMVTKGRTITVEIQKPGADAYVTLQPGYDRDYVAFAVPNQGVRFWNHSTPAGSLYRIHNVKV